MLETARRFSATQGGLRLSLFACAALLLQSCGGGGGDSGGGSQQPAIPQQAPGPVTLSYTGSTQLAAVTDDSAGLLADDAIASMQVLWELGGEFDLANAPVGVVNQTVNGSQGGTAVIVGRIQSATSGWIRITYTGYREQDTTLDGVEIQDSTGGSGTFGARIRRTFDNVRIRQTGSDTTISCNVIVEESTGVSQRKRVTGDFVVRDQATNGQVRLENGAVEFTRPNGVNTWTLSGRISDSARGVAELQTVNAVVSEGLVPDRYIGGGPLRIRGAGVPTLWVAPLNLRSVALEIDGSGRGVAERSARFDWASDFAAQIRPAAAGRPAAILGNDRSVGSDGSAVSLDARFSSHGDGRLMSYRWRVVQEPPGGVASIAASDLPRATATLAGAGDYLIELVASDGTHSTRDVVAIEVSGSNTQDPLRYRRGQVVFAPPALRVATGTRVDIDLTPSVGDFPGTIVNSASVFDSSGSAVTLIGSGLKPAFVPQSPGVYQVAARFTNQTRFDEGLDAAWVYVGREPWLDRPVLLRTNQGAIKSVAAARFDPSRGTDLAVVSVPPFGASAPFSLNLRVYRGTAQSRRLRAPELLDTNVGPGLLAADVIGDARPDIAAGVAAGIHVYEQRADGSYAAPVPLAGVPGCDPLVIRENSPLLLLDADGDGRQDVVRASVCGDRLEAYLRRADGSLATAVALTVLASTQVAIAAADLDGDGRSDVVSRSDDGDYSVIYQRAAGAWSVPELIEVGGNNGTNLVPEVCLGDVNGDQRVDLVASANRRVGVLLQSPAGTLAAPVFYTTRGGPSPCVVTDLTRDGRNDVVLTLSYLAQRADGSLQAEERDPFHLVGPDAASVLADLDGDGFMDAVYGAGTDLQLRPGL